ncbi:hypothetical protein BJV82DRAFT_536349, partial [Fennellomyces sp. T-0311]
MTIQSAPSGNIDITPVLDYLRQLSDNDQLEPADLTRKLAWLLGVCGFMRPSDIERVDLDQSIRPATEEDPLVLFVVAPKEKRQGKHITKTVTLARHTVVLFCPVQAFLVYMRRIASSPCIAPHSCLSQVTINYLMQDLHDFSSPIKAQCIGKHIKSIMKLIPSDPSNKPIKARALGSTRAVQAGANINDVVVHGGWSSQAIFEKFYRLSKETRTNFTSLAL